MSFTIEECMKNIMILFGFLSFILATYAFVNIFNLVEPSDLTPVGHALGFVGFSLMGCLFISLYWFFNDIKIMPRKPTRGAGR